MAAIVCAILQMLAPKEGTGRILRLMTAAFFICAMISPLLSLKDLSSLGLDFTAENAQNGALEQQMSSQLSEQMGPALESSAAEVLAPYHLSVKKVEAKVDTSADGSIYIDHITVTLDKQQTGSRITIQKLLEEKWGTAIEMTTEGDAQ